ncbi:hypothetical protein ED741_15575 [Escherichia coli]|nr:hypothetical protein [Escherichia coli]
MPIRDRIERNTQPLLCPAGHCINVTLSYTFIDRNLNPKKIKKHPKTDVYKPQPSGFLLDRNDTRCRFAGLRNP